VLEPPGLPERLEVPASLVDLEGRSASGAVFTIHDGQAWFDRSGRIPRVNIALGKTATQSSTAAPIYAAANAVDGVMNNFNHTSSTPQASWQVDLGAKMPIETVQIHNRFDCCGDRLNTFWVLISDELLPDDLTAARAQATVAMRHYGSSPMPIFTVNAIGRHVRIQLEGHNSLHVSEVEVWAPASAARENLAVGRSASHSADHSNPYLAPHGVDGLTNAHFEHTDIQAQPWWQVDLGAVREISTVSLFKRPECCADHPQNFYLLVSDEAMTGTLDQILAHAAVKAYFYPSVPMVFEFPIHHRGRFVRLQLTGTYWFFLNEVQVWGQQPSLMPLSRTGVPQR